MTGEDPLEPALARLRDVVARRVDAPAATDRALGKADADQAGAAFRRAPVLARRDPAGAVGAAAGRAAGSVEPSLGETSLDGSPVPGALRRLLAALMRRVRL